MLKYIYKGFSTDINHLWKSSEIEVIVSKEGIRLTKRIPFTDDVSEVIKTAQALINKHYKEEKDVKM